MLVADEWAPLVHTVIQVKSALADKSPLAMRAGLTAGLVMVFEGDDYVGRAINLASKLCELAEPGQCLAPAYLEIETIPGVSACPAGIRRIPGFARPLDLVSIDAANDQPGGNDVPAEQPQAQ